MGTLATAAAERVEHDGARGEALQAVEVDEKLAQVGGTGGARAVRWA